MQETETALANIVANMETADVGELKFMRLSLGGFCGAGVTGLVGCGPMTVVSGSSDGDGDAIGVPVG
jgi:hypothetical protein